MQKNNIRKKSPLYRKVFLFSFIFSFLIILLTAFIAFFYLNKQLENQLTDQVNGAATLWSRNISADVVEEAKKSHDKNDQSVKKLNQSVSKLYQLNSYYIDACIIDVKPIDENTLSLISVSERFDNVGVESFGRYTAEKEFLVPFHQSIKYQKTTNTPVYHDQYGVWITSFKPIVQNGNVIAVLAVDIDASNIGSFKLKLFVFLTSAVIIITLFIYFSLKWGLRKLLKPINEIIQGIDSVSAGDFNVKLQLPEDSGMQELEDKFNYMTNRLAILFDRLSDTYRQFDSDRMNIDPKHKLEEAIVDMELILANTKIQKELQQAEKMNAIGQLAASVAHEIRNPMTVVRGFLQILSEKQTKSDEEVAYLQLMIEELNRAEMVISDYLSLAKPDLDKIEKVHASELANKVMGLMNNYALLSKNIVLEMNFDSTIYVRGSTSELSQVLINIVKNGIEAMQSGGTLTLNVKKFEKYGVFEIIDTGIGMTPEELQRLGTAFYSLKEKGTGIGLLVCYQIVKKMKGKIEVKSESGKGTSFEVYIPLY